MKRATVLILGCLLALTVAGVAFGATTKTVRIKDIDFSPSALTIKKGDSVTWRFLDGDTPHNVTSQGAKRFKSSATKHSGSYTVRFTKAGTFSYVCTIHAGMKGKVVVR